jgi:hypothetical protein
MSAILASSPTTTPGSQIDDQTRTLTPLDTAAIDPFFVAVGKADQQLWFAYYSLRPRHTVPNANWDDFSGDM